MEGQKEEGRTETSEPVELPEIETEETLEEIIPKVRRLSHLHPDLIFFLLLELIDYLISAEIMKKEDLKSLIKAGVIGWCQQ